MKYKLLALDLDGTLLQPDLTILPELTPALDRLQKSGVMVVLCTGRAYPSARMYEESLGLQQPVICYNGAVIRGSNGGILSERFVDMEHMKTIIGICEERDWYLQLYNNDSIIVSRVSEHTLADPDYHNMPCHEMGQLSTAILDPTPKLMTVCRPDEAEERRYILDKATYGNLLLTGSSRNLVEMMPKNAGKTGALKQLCEIYSIDQRDVVACGDGENDADMLAFAGTGCAVFNAEEHCKSVADYICRGENGYGVLEVIEKFFAIPV